MLNAQLSQPALGLLVAGDDQADDGDTCDRKPGERISVEAAEIRRQQDGPREDGGRRRGGPTRVGGAKSRKQRDGPRGAVARRSQQVGEVDTSAYDADAVVA